MDELGPAAPDGVIEIELEHCPNCGGELKIIAAILEQPVIEKILTHLGLQAVRRHGQLRVNRPLSYCVIKAALRLALPQQGHWPRRAISA